MPIATAAPVNADQGVALTWTVHLLQRRRGRTTVLALCLGGTFLLGLLLFHNLALALLPVVVLTLSLSEFLLPVRYTLTAQGAEARSLVSHLEMPWGDVRHAYLANDGVKLSPLRRKGSRWESFRGIFVRFDDGNKDTVIETVKRLRHEAEDRGRTS